MGGVNFLLLFIDHFLIIICNNNELYFIASVIRIFHKINLNMLSLKYKQTGLSEDKFISHALQDNSDLGLSNNLKEVWSEFVTTFLNSKRILSITGLMPSEKIVSKMLIISNVEFNCPSNLFIYLQSSIGYSLP